MILLCGLLALLAWVLVRRLTSKKLRLPPSTDGLPFLGHLLTFLQRPESESNDEFFLNKMKKTLGDIFMLNLAGTYAYIVSSPDLIRTVFAHADIQGRPSNKSHKRAFGPRAHGKHNFAISLLNCHSVITILFIWFNLLLRVMVFAVFCN